MDDVWTPTSPLSSVISLLIRDQSGYDTFCQYGYDDQPVLIDLLMITFSIIDNVNKVRLGPDDVSIIYWQTGLKESNKMAICLQLGLNKWEPN